MSARSQVCGSPCRRAGVPGGRRSAVLGDGYQLPHGAIPPPSTQQAAYCAGLLIAPAAGPCSGWVVLPSRYTPPVHPPGTHPASTPRSVRAMHSTATRAVTAVLDPTKEILGVYNALRYSGARMGCAGTAVTLRPCSTAPPSAPTLSLKSLNQPQVIKPASSH